MDDILIPSINDNDTMILLGLIYSILNNQIDSPETSRPIMKSKITLPDNSEFNLVKRLISLLGCDYSPNYTLLTLKLSTEIVLKIWKSSSDATKDEETKALIKNGLMIWNQRLGNLIEMEPILILQLFQYECGFESELSLLRCVVNKNNILFLESRNSVRPIIPLDNVVAVYLLCYSLETYPILHKSVSELNDLMRNKAKISPSIIDLQGKTFFSCGLQFLSNKVSKIVYFVLDEQKIVFVYI